MSFDVSLFSKMEKQDPQFYFNDSLDVSSLKILYDKMASRINKVINRIYTKLNKTIKYIA
jgi:hypothetical protein